MWRKGQVLKVALGIVGVATLVSTVAFVQEPATGKLTLSVSPPEAYTFVDQRAIGPGNQSLRLPPGKHDVIVANYGYEFLRRDVDIQADKTESIEANLQPKGGEIPGPRGKMQFEVGLWKAGDYAVLLNGTSPYYFVGHVDEFNHEIGPWKQDLIVPPGSYKVTVTRRGHVAWSGQVSVSADSRTIVDISNGKQRTTDWPRGAALAAQPRFKADTASAAINIAPVSGTIAANPSKIDCSQSSQVKWAAMETIDNDISGMSPVAPVGEKMVSPRQTTTYELTGVGPGGTVKTSATVEVNPVVVAQIQTSPSEVKYRRIGDKVLVQNSSTLSWSASNVDSVAVSQIGSEPSQGTQTMQVVPTQTAEGPVDETITYSLRASNVCGGQEVKTAAIHVTGSIEPIPAVLLNSVFFPTDYPEKQYPSVGLVASQQETLTALVGGFNKYLEYDPDAKISLMGYADTRGPNKYNQSLSERRVQSVKDYLIAQGISEDKIMTLAYGDEQQLDKSAVEQTQASNPNQPPEFYAKRKSEDLLAHNRRVDIVLLPKNQESLHFYPYGSPDMSVIWQRAKPSRKAVEEHAAPPPTPQATAQLF